jgi:hypothetical protein
MIFAVRQLQEKCIEQNIPLYAVFIDLTKAFDTVSREALWKILLKLGCPTKFVNVLRQLQEGMQARVCSEGQLSDSFPINNGVIKTRLCCSADSIHLVLRGYAERLLRW